MFHDEGQHSALAEKIKGLLASEPLSKTHPIGFEHYGLRITGEPEPGYALDEGKWAPPSRNWDDGNPTDDYLPGTSTLGFDPTSTESIQDALGKAGVYTGNKPFDRMHIIGADRRSRGDDPGEHVLYKGSVVKRMFSNPAPLSALAAMIAGRDNR